MPHSNSPDASIPDFTTDVVVVGAGPAGLFQLFQLGLQGLACHAIEALPHPGGQCSQLYADKPIYDIPALLRVTGHELSEQLHQQLAPFAIHWHWGQTLEAIEEDGAGHWLVHTSQGHAIACKAVVLALGVGAFVARKPKLEHLDALLAEGRQAFLQSHDRQAAVAGQQVVVFGGDEAAVAKVIELAQSGAALAPARVSLLHRRDVFKADETALAQLNALREQGRIHVEIGQLQALNLHRETALQSLHILSPDGQSQTVPTDVLLVYQGISPKLGALADWQLALEAKHILVNPATQATNRPGIYAVGDIASYPGKRKLIASAFHEAIMAAFAIAEQLQGKSPLTLYTTTHTVLLERLGQEPVAKA